VEIPILRKDKAIRLALWNSANIYDNSGKNLVATIAQGTDITERKNAEEQLRETHDYLENLLNYANAPIIVWDKDFKIKRFNHAFEHLTGYTSEMMLGKKLDTLFPQESKEESLQKIRRTLSGEYWESVEIPILRKDKAIRIALWNSANIYDNSGKNLVATIAQGTDITERKKAEDAVLQAKLEWERTFNSVPDLIAILDKSHKIVQVNKAMAQRLGIPADQCINLNCHMCVHGATKPPAFCPHTLTLKDGKEHVAEVFEDKLGGYFLVSTTPIFDNKRTLLGAVHVARDITERKQAEEALKESEKRLNRAQELAHLGSWELDLINNHLTWSDEVYRIFGLQPQEFEATYEAFLRSVHPEDRAAVDAAYSGSLREGRDTYEIEHRVVRKNGDIRVVYEKCEHIRDKSEKILQSIGMVHDITERKRTEAELVRLASFPLKNPAPIIEVDLSGTIQYLNPVSQQLFPDLEKKGFNHSFLKGIKKLIPEIQKSKTLVQEIHVNDKWFLQTITYIPENRRIRIYSTDITLRKKTEEVLQESEEKYRSIVENTTNVIMVTQPDGIISYLSPACKDVLGHDPNELVGTNPMIFHPEDVTRVQQALSRALNGIKGSNFQYRIITNDGKTKWISHSWAPIQKDSKLHSIVSVIEDITQSKIAEENIKKLNENLLRHSFELATANKELEAFSYSVSHDLRAPLRSIDGFGQAILEDYADKLDEQGKDYIQRVRTATQRMGQLIDDLLRLSRLSRAELHVEQIDLSSLARTTAEKFQASEPSRKVKITIQDQISISGDKKLLEILFENLLGNAWKFTGNTKHPMIKFGETTKDGERVYYIQDNGAGFDMAYADKLFIPFQRLHSVDEYPGTGIGLAIVSRVVRRHGGRIWAESEVDKGATFYFTLQERGVE
jgi:PAS domain S-box-containing protein